MSAPQISHHTLNAEFKGTARKVGETAIHQFRGIKYASVPARFERAEPVNNFNGASVDATQYGYVLFLLSSKVGVYRWFVNASFRPRCPQAAVDVRHLLRIPEDFEIPDEPEDEFECLNLDITCPPFSANSGPLPVLIWIHGA